MKIGLFIKSYKSLFTNGCAQQCYFVLKSLRKSNHDVSFITIEDDYKKYELIDEDIYNACDINVLKLYDIVIFTSLIVDQFKLLNHIKLLGIKIANLIVGNYYIINCEEFVFNVHNNIMKDMNNEYVDEIWLMPMYKNAKNYIQYITKKPVIISPYVWDPEIINKYILQNSLNIKYNVNENINEKKGLDVLIMEPNLSIHKNALPALVILNYYFINYPDRLNAIHLLSKPKSNNLDCISHFDIYKANKIITYPRIVSLDFFSKLIEQNKKFVILSTNIRNGLNFLHLECFSLNIPIIHNCSLFKENGLYYEDSDLKTEYFKVINYLNKTWNDPNSVQNELSTKKILNQFNSHFHDNILKYDLISKNLFNKNKPSIFELNNILKNNINDSDSDNKLKDSLGVIIPINDINNKPILEMNLKTLSKNTIKNWNITIYSSFFLKLNQNYENLNIKIEVCNDKQDNIELYSLSKNKYKYTIFINQFTICYLNLKDIYDVLIDNTSVVGGCKYDFELEIAELEKKKNYLENLYSSFDKKYNELFDKNCFFFINSKLIINTFNNVYNNYLKLKSLFSDRNYVIPILFDLISTKKKLNISSERKIITNNLQEPLGYSNTSTNTLIFITFDNVPNNLKTILLSKYSKSIKYKFKKKIYRKIEFKDKFQYISI